MNTHPHKRAAHALLPADAHRPALGAVALPWVAGLVFSALLIHGAQAAEPATPTRSAASLPNPADARALVPGLEHRSALATYRRWDDQPVGSWHRANEVVNRIGGWRTYAREAPPFPAASTPGSAASGAPASAPSPTPNPPAR